jgi:hypothetical protein
MDNRQDDKEVLTEEVGESLGEPEAAISEVIEAEGKDNDPLYVQKRLKQQKRAHDRDMRELQARISQMQTQLSPQQPQFQEANSPYDQGGNSGSVEDAIRKAVSFALQQRDVEERKARDMQSQAHISRQYQDLQKHLDSTADKYDDFDEVVRGETVNITPHMRDAALMLPKKGAGSAGEVLYKLGKNPEELIRISKLPPIDQASELVKLSHALVSGGEQKGSSPRPLGQIKANPVTNSQGVTEKTSPAAIRALMKAGKFK